jgi:RNA recognition motif-containing protein
MDIFAGSLPFKLKEHQLRAIFEKYGEVSSVKIIIDRITRQNKGFGFVVMPNEDQAKHAIKELNGVELDGRAIKVYQALSKTEKEHSENHRENNHKSGNTKKRRKNSDGSQRRFGYLSYDKK